MSRANTPLKVLRTARKRLARGWEQGAWHRHKAHGSLQGTFVCIEGAITSGHPLVRSTCSPAQMRAGRYVEDAILEWLTLPETAKRFGHTLAQGGLLLTCQEGRRYNRGFIPTFNDFTGMTKEVVLEVMDLAIFNAELAEGAASATKTETPAFEWTMPQPGIITVPDSIVFPPSVEEVTTPNEVEVW